MAAGFRNTSFDDRDTITLRYQGSWNNQGTFNASSVDLTGTLSSSNDPNANVTFVFPEPAFAFYYYGIRRSRGGTYGICVDCDPSNRHFETIDALNSTDDGKNPPVLLFSRQFPNAAVHEIILRNEPDPRFPNNNSQITVDRFEIEVGNPIDPNAPPPSSSPASTPTTTQITSTPASTSLSNSTTVPVTPQGSPNIAVGAIVGGVLGGLALLLVILAIWLWRRKKSRGTMGTDTPEQLDFDPSLQSQPIPGRMSEVWTIASRPVYSRNDTTGVPRKNHRPGPSLWSSSEWTSTVTSPGVNRREVDAGPVGGGEDAEALPPDYEQVVSGSPTRSRLRLHDVIEDSNRGEISKQ